MNSDFIMTTVKHAVSIYNCHCKYAEEISEQIGKFWPMTGLHMCRGRSVVTMRCSMIWLRRCSVCFFSTAVIGPGGIIRSYIIVYVPTLAISVHDKNWKGRSVTIASQLRYPLLISFKLCVLPRQPEAGSRKSQKAKEYYENQLDRHCWKWNSLTAHWMRDGWRTSHQKKTSLPI